VKLQPLGDLRDGQERLLWRGELRSLAHPAVAHRWFPV